MEITFDGNKVVTAHFEGHVVKTDQSIEDGGENSAPSPFELFLASMGTCAGIYVKGFCEQRNISTEGMKIIQDAKFSLETGLPTHITIDIQVPEGFPEKYKSAIVHVAGLCKVKQTLSNPPVFELKATTK